MVGIVFFAYFYISIVFRPDDIADNMRKYGGFIPASVPAGARQTSSTTSSPASPWWARST